MKINDILSVRVRLTLCPVTLLPLKSLHLNKFRSKRHEALLQCYAHVANQQALQMLNLFSSQLKCLFLVTTLILTANTTASSVHLDKNGHYLSKFIRVVSIILRAV